MIISGFSNDTNGNRCVNISDDTGKQKFKIQINQNGFEACRSVNNAHPYFWSDKTKSNMENEIRNYVRKHGTSRQKLIVDYV